MKPPSIIDVRATGDRLVFVLDTDREISLPHSISRRLAAATDREREAWVLGEPGLSVRWPELDEDIAIWDALGIPESAFLAPLRPAPTG